jgi:hypothetical protein
VANAASSFYAHNLAGKVKPMGWIAVICGGLLLLLSHGTKGQEVMWKLGIDFIAGGLILVVLFGSNRPVKSFSFTIEPPWYRTFWMEIVWGILVILIVYLFIRCRSWTSVSGVWYWPKRSPSGGRLAISMTYGEETVILGP